MPYIYRMATQINYIEFQSNDLEATEKFYTKCFDWKFTSYGPTYIAFENSGIEGGFAKGETGNNNSVLVVLYNNDLEGLIDIIESHGGTITKDIFSFPGGRRFHFIDPSGNELAVWSE